MIYSGTIKLIDAVNDVLREELYTNREHRDRIEKGWWEIYGEERMRKYFIQYVPDVPESIERRIIEKDIKEKYVGKVFHVPAQSKITHYR